MDKKEHLAEFWNVNELVLLCGLKWVLLFLVFYLSFCNVLVLLVIFNNWGTPMEFKIGMRGVEIKVAHRPSSNKPSSLACLVAN